MNRRRALQTIGGSALAMPLLASSCTRTPGLAPSAAGATSPAGKASVLDADGLVGGRSLEALHERYMYDLFEDFLPFMEEEVIDHRYGGFMCNADRAGRQVDTDKLIRYEGRGIWVYAYLYRTLAPEEKYLEVARKSLEFILPHEPEGDLLWPSRYTREGEALAPPGDHNNQMYDDLFVAEGLAEYARATGEMEHWDHAKQIILKALRIYDHPEYAPRKFFGYFVEEVPPLPGCRILGVPMVLTRVTNQMLEVREDPELLAISDRAIDEVFNYFHNPEFDLLGEILNHDLSRPPSPLRDLAYTGHGIETLWMILFEAHRRRDKELFLKTAAMMRRHIEVSWDYVYGGWFLGCRHVDDHEWMLRKTLFVQEEALIGLLFVVEHLGSEWAKDWFREGYELVLDKYPLKPHGYPIWDLNPDRKFTFVEEYFRIGNYHHPRHLMLNIEMIRRMMDRNARVSNDFA